MMKLTGLIVWCWFGLALGLSSAEWQVQKVNTDTRFVGLCAVDEKIVWGSGTKGTFVRTVDAGKNWQVGQVAGGEKLIFGDVEALDGETAWLLSGGEGTDSRIYKTTDGGNSWELQFQNETPKARFNDLAFWDEQNGVAALSDPMNARFLLVGTTNGGARWEPLKAKMPDSQWRESAFPGMGNCLVAQGQSNLWFATRGGVRARIVRSVDRGETWSSSRTPESATTNTVMIYGLAFRDEQHGAAVGSEHGLIFSEDAGESWQQKRWMENPFGFHTGVAWLDAPKGWAVVAVGPTGSTFRNSKGEWKKLDNASYTVVGAGRFNPKAVWAAGAKGRIARLVNVRE
jgi:photosystem II stability/assembly factor-like uncharacterized protein